MKARERKVQVEEEKNVIEAFICPITLEKFKEPVIASDGHTYERAAILRWFEHHDTSPRTGQRLISKILVNNWALKASIEEADLKLRTQAEELNRLRGQLQMSWWEYCFFRKPLIEEDKPIPTKRRLCG